jgi:hypothetical protein
MHRDRNHDRNHGSWTELKAKRHDKFDNPKFDDAPLESLSVIHSHLDNETRDIQKVKKDRAAKQLSHVQHMFKGMIDYADKKSLT